jgi:hypothetical protein
MEKLAIGSHGRMILLLAYFPKLYEDELLYSGIARYHKHSGNRTQKQTIKDLFGDRLVCATVDLPSHLEQLSRRIRSGYTTEQLIENHTLFPYYTYFMHPKRREEVKTLMAMGATEGVVHTSLGLIASHVKTPDYLRYCPVCLEEERARKEPYWHRSHQLPGVVFCPIHKKLLNQSNILFSTRDHKFAFVPLTEFEPGKTQTITIKSDWIDHLLFITEQSARLLTGKTGKVLPNYRGNLIEKHYLTVGGKVRFDRLIDDVHAFYGEDLLQFLNCGINPGGYDTWLHKLIRGEDGVNQPLRHLLLLRYFGHQVGVTFHESKYIPFGNGPWPCLNKAADHYRSNVVEKCVITRCSKTKLPVGTFYCVCGFVYSRRGPDKIAEDRYRIGRIKDFGAVWQEKLIELNRGGLSLRAKAALQGVDPTTVKKQSLTFSKEKASVTHKNTIVADRTVRHSGTKSKSQRVNWKLRDELILVEANEAVRKLRKSDKPHRITLSSISRHMPTYGLSLKILKQDVVKLPKTRKFLQSALESTTEFQIRRLEWAAIKLREEEYKIMDWKLLRLAGLRSPLSDPVLRKYHELLEMK